MTGHEPLRRDSADQAGSGEGCGENSGADCEFNGRRSNAKRFEKGLRNLHALANCFVRKVVWRGVLLESRTLSPRAVLHVRREGENTRIERNSVCALILDDFLLFLRCFCPIDLSLFLCGID